MESFQNDLVANHVGFTDNGNVGIGLFEKTHLSVALQLGDSVLHIIIPDGRLYGHDDMSAGLAQTKQIVQAFATHMAGGENPTGNDRAIAPVQQIEGLRQIGDMQFAVARAPGPAPVDMSSPSIC